MTNLSALAFIVFCLSLLLPLALALAQGPFLRYRIRRNIEAQGGRVVNIQPHRFYPGPMTELDRLRTDTSSSEKQIFLVEYIKINTGQTVVRMCQITLLGGFYWYEP